jgi:hypothetical protein
MRRATACAIALLMLDEEENVEGGEELVIIAYAAAARKVETSGDHVWLAHTPSLHAIARAEPADETTNLLTMHWNKG